MKIQLSLAALLVCSSSLYAKEITTKSTEAEQVGYSFGYLMGKNNADTLKGIDLDAFSNGLKAAASGQKATIAEEEMAKVLLQYKRQSDARELIELKKKAEENAKIGREFLAKNAKRPGIKTTKSGLQYLVLQEGKGKSPSANSNVKVHYEGRLLDGTVFDSSIARNQPVVFKTTQVIQGWTEGLQLMKPGAKYRFFIPPELGYGQIGSGDVIEPNSTLIFDIELIEVTK
ncbi:FKBP-type peptidyl-prolyl cis-trans isomerase [Acinetobacter sp. ANC 7454]|uniref:FKBP-type peptidyl-prolyl cis-trans isomerase n=1 Tax=Acinetobacter thermotolerans TaxID=3151487 RepID=UPI00325B6041